MWRSSRATTTCSDPTTTATATTATAAGASSAAGAAHGDPGSAGGDQFAVVQQAACDELAELIGRAQACLATGVPRSSWYRHNRVAGAAAAGAQAARRAGAAARAVTGRAGPGARAAQHHLSRRGTGHDMGETAGRGRVPLLDLHHVPDLARARRGDRTPPERHAPAAVKPELMATKPNQVWTWDVTKLAGPARGVWFCLYVIIDIFSRYTPGWMIAHTEDGELARRFLRESITKHGIDPDTLTLHADRGSAMKSKSVAELLSDLHVTRSHSRPKTSNDNPYSEAQFKTLKYRPVFPDRFDSIEHARQLSGEFFRWYNHDHRHSGIGLHTPASVHFGTANEIRQQRGIVLAEAYTAHPERFVHGTPQPPELPDAVWINPPTDDTGKEEIGVPPGHSTQ